VHPAYELAATVIIIEEQFDQRDFPEHSRKKK
jgi:hypothetical protein